MWMENIRSTAWATAKGNTSDHEPRQQYSVKHLKGTQNSAFCFLYLSTCWTLQFVNKGRQVCVGNAWLEMWLSRCGVWLEAVSGWVRLAVAWGVWQEQVNIAKSTSQSVNIEDCFGTNQMWKQAAEWGKYHVCSLDQSLPRVQGVLNYVLMFEGNKRGSQSSQKKGV